MIVVALFAGGQILVNELLPFGFDVEPEAPELLGVVLGVGVLVRGAAGVVVHQPTPDAENVPAQAFDVGGEYGTVECVADVVVDRVIVDAEASPFDVAQVGLWVREREIKRLERLKLETLFGDLIKFIFCRTLTSAKVFV